MTDAIAHIEALINQGRYFEARAMAQAALPSDDSLRLKQLLALAMSKAGVPKAAVNLLEPVYRQHADDPETAGIMGGIYKEIFRKDQDTKYALLSRDTYPRKEVAPKTAPPTKATPTMTLADFYQQRFEPEHVRLQKHATRDYYAKMWRNHLGPLLGALPLRALDEDRISAFRAALHGRLAASTANVVLSKLGKMLRFARKLRTIELVPNIERLPVPRKRPMAVLSDEAIARLVAAARRRGADGLAVSLLALDAGMRVSEICALEWGDIDLHEGAMIVQHNVYHRLAR